MSSVDQIIKFSLEYCAVIVNTGHGDSDTGKNGRPWEEQWKAMLLLPFFRHVAESPYVSDTR